MIYEISRKASAQIDDIIRYTDETFGPAQTEKYLSGLYNTFDLLADNPLLGREWMRGKRRYVYRSHYVFYRLFENRILITDIRNTRMAPLEDQE